MMGWRGMRAGLALVVVAGVAISRGWGQDGGVAARGARLTLLSDGVVLVGRNGSGDTAPAQQNMALAQGSLVLAMDQGQAEIEFEDGSVVRLTPQSSVSLDSLASNGDGTGYLTTLRVHGLVYLELRASGVARYRVLAGADSFWPVENATVRVSLEDPPAVISVLDGRIRVEHVSSPAGLTVNGPQAVEGYRADVRAGESLRSDAGDVSRYFLTESVPPGTWDQWNEERDQAAANEVASGTPVRQGYEGQQGYGWSDLDASGNWYGAAGQTPVWQPDEALEAGFDPYGYGSWVGFSGAGYVWASAYSWGWTPYRCGTWQFWSGFGWGWQPNLGCGFGFQYGGYGVNIGRGPRGYLPIQVPIKRPGGVHPILPGPHSGVRFALTRGPRQTTEVGGRTIAGVVMEPIPAAGTGYTARGGSAVGSSLRRDFPVDGRTHQALMGMLGSSGPVAVSPVSAGVAWRSVATRPEASAGTSSGGFRSLFGRGERQDAPVRLDAKGNPYSEPARRGNDGSTGKAGSQGFAPGGQQRSQPVNGAAGYRGPVNAPSGPHYTAPPAPVMRSAPAMAPAPAMHSAPAAPASAGAAKR